MISDAFRSEILIDCPPWINIMLKTYPNIYKTTQTQIHINRLGLCNYFIINTKFVCVTLLLSGRWSQR